MRRKQSDHTAFCQNPTFSSHIICYCNKIDKRFLFFLSLSRLLNQKKIKPTNTKVFRAILVLSKIFHYTGEGD